MGSQTQLSRTPRARVCRRLHNGTANEQMAYAPRTRLGLQQPELMRGFALVKLGRLLALWPVDPHLLTRYMSQYTCAKHERGHLIRERANYAARSEVSLIERS